MTTEHIVEPPERHLARIDAAMSLAFEAHQCDHCTPTAKVIAMHGELPAAYSITHQPACPHHEREHEGLAQPGDNWYPIYNDDGTIRSWRADGPPPRH